MLCGLYYLVLSAVIIQDAYIKHSDFPGGPFLYEDSTYNTQPAIVVGLVCYLIVDISTAAIQIWRLWVVWSATRYAWLVVILPFLCFLGFTAFRIRSTFLDVVLTGAEVFSQNLKPRTAELALQAIITILPTILIAGFLIFQNRRQRKLIGKSQLSTPYMNVVAMLIESYAVESTWTILHVILLDLRHPALQFFADTRLYIEIIAYLLVLYRVANGRAYELQRTHGSQSRQDNVSLLQWNHITTQSDVSSETDTNIFPAGKQPELGVLRRGEGSPA
ncbi:hypothetical protein Agabi119p4_10400 [Agaricus bisporus var. burnettii]|uniref:Uncharacterized protein n=1 Tax=Agaricus bisporus var. burnettii TaxID=192524 RepID=A0A8H7EWE3_AGABI|nr:hypothetical protein Agabi119p4_10400 [Agaricus bisporus var. burnettii]